MKHEWRIQALYALAYAVRMMPKKGFTPEGYVEYTVYPLEGVWDLTEKGRKSATLDKDELVYTLMIRQPDFVDEEVVQKAFGVAQEKKGLNYLKDATFETIEEGLCVQMLHVGPFENEPETFKVMEEFTKKEGLQRASLTHKEIYLSDIRKAAPEKWKTVLRYKVSD